MKFTTFYFDTSAINALLGDPEQERLERLLTGDGKVVFISSVNIAELAATSDPARRESLLRLAKRLAKKTRPLALPRELFRTSLDAFATEKAQIDTTSDPTVNNLWIALDHPQQVTEAVRAEIQALNRGNEAWYREMHENARPAMRKELESLPRFRNATHLTKIYWSSDKFITSALRPFVIGLRHPELVGREREVVGRCEFWKFFFAAFVAGIYHRAIKDHGFGYRTNAGSADTQQAIYIPTCDVFVSNDQAQFTAFRPLAPLAHKPRRVVRYGDVRRNLLAGRY